MKHYIKNLSTFLALLMIYYMLPVFAFAKSSNDNNDLNTINKSRQSFSEACISAEINSRRGEFEKHYLLSDGSFIAVSYSEAVHYKNKDGLWNDVDNTLVVDKYSNRIVNSYDEFKVSFAGTGSNENIATISSKDSIFSWDIGIEKRNAGEKSNNYEMQKSVVVKQIENNEKELGIGRKAKDSESLNANKISGKISYLKLFNNAPEISAAYTVFHNKIEEDIFINQSSDVKAFTLTFNSHRLSADIKKDNSVDIINENGDVKFRIGVPYMEDAKGEILNDIKISISKDGKNTIIKYLPNEEWLFSAERAYPILFDPSITTNEYSSNIVDTYVYEGNTENHSSEQKMYFGIKSNKIHRSYIKINNLPAIDVNMPILSATLQLAITVNTTTGKTAKVYKATGSWNPSTITYSNQPYSSSSTYYLDSCSYSSSSLYYTFNIGLDMMRIYDDYNAAINYGYVVRYADESLSDPDYNAVYSTDYTTSSKRPLVIINYGYSLPIELINGGIYAFQNSGSGSYLTVHNGSDSNAVNVYQQSLSSFSNITSKQKFKLDYVSSTGGYYLRAMCSSSGTNRVLDIVKNGGYVVNGCNVEIYNPIDSIAQHWFIIGVGSLDFKIVPRTNMNLALTVYPSSSDGTSSGTSSSSVGNIFVSTYDDSNNYQKWKIRDENGNYKSGGTQILENTTYYLNNLNYGKYLHKYGSGVNAASGLISDLENTIRWKITYVGNNLYTIQSAVDYSKYLYASTGTQLTLISAPSSGIFSDKYLWNITYNSGIIIKNIGVNRYLYQDGSSSISITSYLGTIGTNEYNKRVWRVASTSYYGNSPSNERRELSLQTSILNIESSTDPNNLTIIPITINPYYNEIWISQSDFTYEYSNTGIVNYSNGSLILLQNGGTKINATHKITNRVKTFYVLVGFSTTISNTPSPISNNQPYDVWPASEESRYYGCPTTYRIDCLTNIYIAAQATVLGGNLLDYPDAADMLSYFLGNTGDLYVVNMKRMINEWNTAQSYRNIHINSAMKAVEASADSSNKTFRTIEAFPCNVNEGTNWGRAIGSYNTSIICTFRKTSSNAFTMQVTYELYDVYDWKRTETSMGNLPVTPRDMWELHHGGLAKNYEVHGQNTFTVSWTSGQTFENGAIISNET